jgi:hypothetical protein
MAFRDKIQGQVGPQVLQDGVREMVRLGRTAELNIGQGHGKYYEAVYRGNVYHCSNGLSGTGAFVPGGSTLSSSTDSYCLYNPASSGKNLLIMKVTAGFVTFSNTAAGTVYIAVNNLPQAAAPGEGRTGVVVNALIGCGNQPVGVPSVNPPIPLSATPIALTTLCVAIITNVTGNPSTFFYDVDNAIVVGQGFNYISASGSPTGNICFGATWEEVLI